MTRLLALLALRWAFLRKVLVGIGIVFAAYYWLQLTTTTGAPVDTNWYWSANPNDLYPHPELLERNGYNYSPAFEVVVGWGRHLPFDAFAAVWRGILLVVFVWLAGPIAAPVMFLPPVASEINAGNIQILLAAAIVVGFRHPAAWAFVLLTKVTPGVGLLWFALRRRWRDLAVALGATAAIAGVAFVVWPDRWFGWFELLTAGSPPPVPPYNLPLLPRLAAAVAVVALAAWRGWRWPVVVAAMLALPAFYFLSPSILVGVIPFAREWAGGALRRRREAASVRLPAGATGGVPSLVTFDERSST
ncbi:MAG: DUF2029 domain-containing protein [Chloroflexi bacterium]|nr:DUF2029 domain-containing protein [Chloroflexota bacterium]